MKQFGYWRDPLSLGCTALYALNRWVIKPHVRLPLFHCWFNDALLIPCALPIALWLQRRFGLRSHDRAPTPGEVAAHTLGWSILFEAIGPHLTRRATGDIHDVIAYSLGAIAALLFWRWRELQQFCE